MKIFFDTNVILDVLLDREPFVEDAFHLLAKVERSEVTGVICATTVTTIYYLVSKSLGIKEATRHIKTLLSIFEIAPVNRAVLEEAIDSRFSDFEDAILHASALTVGADCIVTRDFSGFKKSKIPVYTPNELLSILQLSS
ncbi:type II toxin-antitoxin system VapC family toxin [Thermosulfurimonas dismutans]|uniref:PIN domain protein n=1 Tax=Thermosulfurimonas dismutans TaxID=999894 RepID=A0A179D429_9BACT|nr:PIN domain-containing protein [Thermosulfurimonas dismutans]OAQ20232.1 PIN domain protein [Thermosulfurimonas dismutans]